MDGTATSQNQPSASAASRLPPELTDAIIDAGKDDKRFLKTCGLVCRAWVPASRRHLFDRVTVHLMNAGKFNSLLQSELVTFPRHIRNLKISYYSFNAGSLPQVDFRSLTQLSIVKSFFDSFDDLTRFFLACHVPEDLSLDDTSWRRSFESVPMTGSLPSLRHVAIRLIAASEDVLIWLLSLQPVPALQSFIFNAHYPMQNVLQINTLLQILGPSLRHLDLDGAVSHLWCLSHNTELQTFTVSLDLQKFHYSLTKILSSLGSISSNIRYVVFNIFEVGRYDDDDQTYLDDYLGDLDLHELDQFLCQPQFLHLQAIRFHLRDYEAYEEAKSVIELNMPASLSRGMLSIQNE